MSLVAERSEAKNLTLQCSNRLSKARFFASAEFILNEAKDSGSE